MNAHTKSTHTSKADALADTIARSTGIGRNVISVEWTGGFEAACTINVGPHELEICISTYDLPCPVGEREFEPHVTYTHGDDPTGLWPHSVGAWDAWGSIMSRTSDVYSVMREVLAADLVIYDQEFDEIHRMDELQDEILEDTYTLDMAIRDMDMMLDHPGPEGAEASERFGQATSPDPWTDDTPKADPRVQHIVDVYGTYAELEDDGTWDQYISDTWDEDQWEAVNILTRIQLKLAREFTK